MLFSLSKTFNTTLKIIERIEERVSKNKYLGTEELNQILREEIASLLSETNSGEDSEFTVPQGKRPYVIMVVGVNGAGKTTTIGKLAYQQIKQLTINKANKLGIKGYQLQAILWLEAQSKFNTKITA